MEESNEPDIYKCRQAETVRTADSVERIGTLGLRLAHAATRMVLSLPPSLPPLLSHSPLYARVVVIPLSLTLSLSLSLSVPLVCRAGSRICLARVSFAHFLLFLSLFLSLSFSLSLTLSHSHPLFILIYQ